MRPGPFTEGTCRGLGLVVVTVATAGTAWLLARPALEPVIASPSPLRLPLEDLVVAACGGVLLAGAAWLALGTTLLVLEATVAVTGHSLPRQLRLVTHVVSSRVLRRVVAATCGLAISTTVAGPAAASPAPGPAEGAGVSVTALGAAVAGPLTGLPVPDRAVGPLPRPTRSAAPPELVTVRPGDSLWSLAADRLPDGAGPAATDSLWRAIYRTNADRLGPDPDRIRPGTVLQIPTARPDRKEAR